MAPDAALPGWVGPTIAISLAVIAVVFAGFAVAALFALKALQAQVEHQRAMLAEGRELLDTVKTEVGALVRTSRGVRKAVVRGVRRAQDKLTDLETLYDVVYDEVEDTALDAASALRRLRRGGSVLARLRRLVIPGR